jgi:hypothetical protein
MPVVGGSGIIFSVIESNDPIILDPFIYDGFVTGSQASFGSVPFNIPGKIEAEDFDLGGEGIAFSVQTNNGVGSSYRTESNIVGTEVQLNGIVNIGFTGKDEWLEYTINIEPGIYDLKISYATGVVDIADQRGIKLFIDGVEFFDFDTSAVGGDWSNFLEYETRNIELERKTGAVLKVLWKTAGFNLDFLEFTKVSNLVGIRKFSDEPRLSLYPNPFVDKLYIAIDLESKSDVKLSVFSITGNEIYKVEYKNNEPGNYNFTWNGQSISKSLPTGLYIIKIEIDDQVFIRKAVKN